MSHCPGHRLEDFICDSYRLCVVDLDVGSPFAKACYANQLIITAEQFQVFVEMFEPVREVVEGAISNYLNMDEYDQGSWRDYRNYCIWGNIPKEIEDRADEYCKELWDICEKTKGLFGDK